MQIIHPIRVLLALAGIGVFAFAATIRAQIIIGSGADASYAVIEERAFGEPLVYEYRYDFDPDARLDGYALFAAIDSAVPELSLDFKNFSDDPQSPNYFLDSITYGANTVKNTPAPTFTPYWSHWVSGGVAGFPVASSIPSSVWRPGSGVSNPYRLIEPGSWDGFVFNDGASPPSVEPIPEPKTWVLFLAGSTLVLWMLRRRHEEKRI